MNLVEMLERNRTKFADKAAIRSSGHTITYAELGLQADRAAAALQALGVSKGDRVAIMSLNTPAFVYAFYGALKAGAAVVPVNHKLAAPEVDYIVDHSRARVLLFDGSLAPVMGRMTKDVSRIALDTEAAGYPAFEGLMAEAGAPAPVPVADDDMAEVLYTSGTTGKPKGCMHSHRNVIMAGITAALAVKLEETDRLLMAMPIWHSSPLNNWFVGTQYMGGTTVFLREYHPVHFLEAVQSEECTVYFGAPISYLAPLQMVPNFADYDLTGMRAWIYGGGPIDSATARVLTDKYRSTAFYQVYGMTESGPTGTKLRPDEQLAHAGSIGRTGLPGADLRVMKSPAQPAGPGEVGEVWLKADSMMQGYLDDPEATARAFTDGWYRTGDIARVDAEGYLFIVDRSKDMIVTGGENVYSKEVEDALAAHPAVMESAVVGRPHVEWGETVVAYLVPKAGETVDETSLRTFLGERLAQYKVPRVFHVVDALPHTPTGKVMKYQLREREREG